MKNLNDHPIWKNIPQTKGEERVYFRVVTNSGCEVYIPSTSNDPDVYNGEKEFYQAFLEKNQDAYEPQVA